MSKFSIAILQRGQNPHVACFEDVSAALAASLRELGHEVVDFNRGGRLIVFGANNARPIDGAIPDDTIIFNTEQMTFFGGNVRTQMQNFDEWARRMVIWDYSQENIRRLREAGAERVVHCPIGYHKSMTFIEPAPVEDIDVLFYGSVNPRRREVLDALDKAGIKVEVLFGAYGKVRDEHIARSKIVLNIHCMPETIFEIFRVSHLLANGKCVVSEDGGKDAELEALASKMTGYCPRDKIVDTCKFLLAEEPMRKTSAAIWSHRFKKTSFVDNIRRALEQS